MRTDRQPSCSQLFNPSLVFPLQAREGKEDGRMLATDYVTDYVTDCVLPPRHFGKHDLTEW